MLELVDDAGGWCHLHRLEEKVAWTRPVKGEEVDTNLPGADFLRGRERSPPRMRLAHLALEAQEVSGVQMTYPVRTPSEGMAEALVHES